MAAIPCDEARDFPGDNCLEVIGNYTGDPDIDYMTNLTELTRLAVGRL